MLNFTPMREFRSGLLVGAFDMNAFRDNLLYLRERSRDIISYGFDLPQSAGMSIQDLPTEEEGIDAYEFWVLAQVTGTGAPIPRIQLNNNSTAGNYESQRLVAGGASVSSSRDTESATLNHFWLPSVGTDGANSWWICRTMLYNVRNTARHVLSFANISVGFSSGIWSGLDIGVWKQTAVVTRIDLTPAANQLSAGHSYVLRALRF
jgi:hypothetical protein